MQITTQAYDVSIHRIENWTRMIHMEHVYEPDDKQSQAKTNKTMTIRG